MAVSFAQPTDVVKVRFQAQMNLSGVARRYNGTMAAYKQIYQLEGFRGLWKGSHPTLRQVELHFDSTHSRPLPPLRRDATQHYEKRTGELHRAGDVRPDQRGHPEAQPAVWWASQLHTHITHPPIETADWAESNTPTFTSARADKPPLVGEDIDIQGG